MAKDALLEVGEQSQEWSPPAAAEIWPDVALYMIRTRRYRPTLFLQKSSLRLCAATDSNRFLRFIRRMMRNRNPVIRWVGRVTRVGHRYYQKLEDRIDPQERMIKALNCPRSLKVLHASSDPESEFRDLLRGQVVKHGAWLVVDGILTALTVMFFWVLVPIPGPNVFFYYPALRLASHYRAMTGARRGLNGIEITFEPMPGLAHVEEELRNPTGADVAPDSVSARIEGLEVFLRRLA